MYPFTTNGVVLQFEELMLNDFIHIVVVVECLSKPGIRAIDKTWGHRSQEIPIDDKQESNSTSVSFILLI